MRKWIVLSGLWIAVFLFHSYVCYGVELKINVPDELTPYIVKIVNKANDEGLAKDKTYVAIDIRQYCENILVSAATSWKNQQDSERLKNLGDMFSSLSLDAQAKLAESLISAVGGK